MVVVAVQEPGKVEGDSNGVLGRGERGDDAVVDRLDQGAPGEDDRLAEERGSVRGSTSNARALAEFLVNEAGAVEVGHQQGHGGDADELAGREHLAGEEARNGAEVSARAAVSASSRAVSRSTRARSSWPPGFQQGEHLAAGGERPGAPGHGAARRGRRRRGGHGRRPDLEPGQTRGVAGRGAGNRPRAGSSPARTALRRDPDLRQDVGGVRGAAGAVMPGVGRTDLGVGAEDQLDRVGEIEREIELAGVATAVLADRLQGVADLAREAARRAKDVPEQDEQALTRGVEAGVQDGVGFEPPAPRQGQRPEPGELLDRPAGQKVAQPFDGVRLDAGRRRGRRAGGRAARARGRKARRPARTGRRRSAARACRRGWRRSARRSARARRGSGRRRPAGRTRAPSSRGAQGGAGGSASCPRRAAGSARRC